MIQLADKNFKFKKDAMEYVREFLTELDGKTIGKGNPFFGFFKDLVSKHPERKIDNLESVEVIRNLAGHIAINIKESDSDYKSISWNRCITGNVAHYKSRLRSAMRLSVYDQISEFKNSYTTFRCAICGENTESDNVHVDHELFFEDIAKDFEKLHRSKTFGLENFNDHRGYQFSNIEDQRKWENFHSDNARLRITCSSCNLKRKKGPQ